MARIKRKDTDPVSDIVQSISYGTGLICAKVSKLGKVTNSKEWKEVVTRTQGMVKNVEKSISGSISDMQESFDEGVQSIVDEGKESEAPKPAARKKDETAPQEAELVNEESEIVEAEPKVVEQQETVVQEEVIVHQEEPALPKEAQIAPLTGELEPTGDGIDDDEDLMDEEESPKKKEASSKKKKKDEVKSELSVEANDFEFTLKEFKKDGKEPKSLMGSIKRNKSEISLGASDPLEWLNELLATGENGQPLKYDVHVTEEINEAKEAFEAASGFEKTQALIKLNRLILEQAYPLKCPKMQIEEPRKSKRSKGSDSEMNLN